MSNNQDATRRQLGAAAELKSVVRAMKALATSSLGQYEKAVTALRDYSQTLELGLIACLRGAAAPPAEDPTATSRTLGIVLFGSDQGLVGQFNESIAEFTRATIAAEGCRVRVWAIGERVAAAAAEFGFSDIKSFEVPGAVQHIGGLVGRLMIAIQEFQAGAPHLALHVMHHRPSGGGGHEPQARLILPVDRAWIHSFKTRRWPTQTISETIATPAATFDALVREYLFICLFSSLCGELGQRECQPTHRDAARRKKHR